MISPSRPRTEAQRRDRFFTSHYARFVAFADMIARERWIQSDDLAIEIGDLRGEAVAAALIGYDRLSAQDLAAFARLTDEQLLQILLEAAKDALVIIVGEAIAAQASASSGDGDLAPGVAPPTIRPPPAPGFHIIRDLC